MRHFIIIYILIFLNFGGNLVSQQRDISQVPTSNDSFTVITTTAEEVFHSSVDNHEMDTLIGSVKMIQDSLIMYCDRAYIVDQMYAHAYDNVVIIHEDSLWIFSDSLYYNGEDKIAYLYGEVILQEGDKRLYTHQLTYDIKTKVASYDTGGTLIENNATIKSREGYYYSKRKMARFIGNVVFADSTKTLFTDSILYFSERKQLNFISPTKILEDSVEIYGEKGIYRLSAKQGVLSQNVQVKSGTTTISSSVLHINQDKKEYTFLINPQIRDPDGNAVGDTIIYHTKGKYVDLIGNAQFITDKEDISAPRIRYHTDTEQYQSFGRASVAADQQLIEADQMHSDSLGMTFLSGNFTFDDPQEGVAIKADAATKKDSVMTAYIIDRQVHMRYLLNRDSLLLMADTLRQIELETNTDSMSQMLIALEDVQLLQGKIVGRSQVFIYSKIDSVITMTDNPVLWSDSIQLSGDTIRIYLQDNSIQRIDLIKNAYILSPEPGGHYNQISGSHISNHVNGKEISRSIANGNVSLLYLIREDNQYQAINRSDSPKMIFNFVDGEIQSVQMEEQESQLYEYEETMDITKYYLPECVIRIDERPIAKRFIFVPIQSKSVNKKK